MPSLRPGSAVLLVVAVAACSGGTNPHASSAVTKTSPTTTTTRVTKALSERAAYITQANAICQVMNAQTRALPSQSADPATIAVVADRAAAITSVALGRLRALHAPAGQANALRAVFAKVDRTLADEAQISAALRSSKITDAERIRTQLQADAAAANAAADAYGLTVCGESS